MFRFDGSPERPQLNGLIRDLGGVVSGADNDAQIIASASLLTADREQQLAKVAIAKLHSCPSLNAQPLPRFFMGSQSLPSFSHSSLVSQPRLERARCSPPRRTIHRLLSGIWRGGRLPDAGASCNVRGNQETGAVSVFCQPSDFANGNTRDRQGRLVSYEHLTRRTSRTEYDGAITVNRGQVRKNKLAERYRPQIRRLDLV